MDFAFVVVTATNIYIYIYTWPIQTICITRHSERCKLNIQSNEHQGKTKEEDLLLSSEITSRRALGLESTLKLPQNLCLRD